MNLKYIKAKNQDIPLLINLYNLSFYSDYKKYGECPAYGRTPERMEYSLNNSEKYIILCDNIPVGVISFENNGNGEYYLGCLCVIPKYQGQNIGTNAFKYLLTLIPNMKQLSLVTPADNMKNIQFYTEKCGCKTGIKEMDGNVQVINLYINR